MEIVPSTIDHIEGLVKGLRDQDRLEIGRLGLDPVKAVTWSYKTAIWKRTAVVEGKVAAMWGVCGTPLSLTGQAYLVTTKASEKVSPLKFARIYLEEAEAMTKIFPHVEAYVDSTYEGAVRLLEIAGFQYKDTVRFNNFPFFKFSKESSWA